jgi:hypothetical protein
LQPKKKRGVDAQDPEAVMPDKILTVLPCRSRSTFTAMLIDMLRCDASQSKKQQRSEKRGEVSAGDGELILCRV